MLLLLPFTFLLFPSDRLLGKCFIISIFYIVSFKTQLQTFYKRSLYPPKNV